MVFKRVRGHLRFAKIVVREGVAIHDKDATLLQVADVRFERGGVHRHQHVHRVTRGEYSARRKLDLETADGREWFHCSAYLGGVVRGIGELVSVEEFRSC